MSAHTPGPWKVYGTRSRTVWGEKAICTVHGTRNDIDEQRDANARLIAAAPDMLTALHEALEFAEDQEDVIDGPDGEPQANKAMRLAQMLREVIGKAEGKA